MDKQQESITGTGLEFERKRGNILILFEKLTQLPLLIATILFTIYAGTNMDYNLIFGAAFVALSPLMQLIKYAFTYYTITDDQLIVESGIWNKKRIEIPLRSITTVDLTQNVLYQVFKTYKIKVDNGSQAKEAANAAEVQFALKADLAFLFKRLVEKDLTEQNENRNVGLNARENEIQKDYKEEVFDESSRKTSKTIAEDSGFSRYVKKDPLPTVKSSPFDFVQLGLLESKLIYIISLFPVLSVVAYILGSIGAMPSEEDALAVAENLFTVFPAGLVIFIFIAILFIGGMVFSVVRSIMTFFGFQISADSKKIYIDYGLLTKRKYTLQKDKISGIVLKQNLLMRIFHKYQIDVIVIGYGDKSDQEVKQQPILFPIATKSKVKEIVETLLPEFKGDYYAESVTGIGPATKRKAFRYFFYQSGFVLATLFLIGSILAVYAIGQFDLSNGVIDTDEVFIINIIRAGILVLGILIESLTIVSIIMQYSNTGMLSGNEIVTIQAGGFHRNITVLKTSCVESITAIASRWKHRRGFSSIRLGYVAPLRTSKIVVRNRSIQEFEDLEEVLDK